MQFSSWHSHTKTRILCPWTDSQVEHIPRLAQVDGACVASQRPMQNTSRRRSSAASEAVVLSASTLRSLLAVQVTTSAIPMKNCSAACFSVITPEVNHSFRNKVPLLEPWTESLLSTLPWAHCAEHRFSFHWSLLLSYRTKNSRLICYGPPISVFSGCKGWYGGTAPSCNGILQQSRVRYWNCWQQICCV